MTQNLLPFTSFVKPALDSFATGTGLSFAGIAKIAPWCLARRDRFSAKVPGPVTGVTAPPTLSAHTRNRYAACKYVAI
jgi:hypothetical protein